MSGYWPWWAGALALGAVTVGYAVWTGRGLGVSGAWAKVVHWRRQRDVERLDAGFDEQQLRLVLAGVAAEAPTAGGSPVSLGRPGPASPPPSQAEATSGSRPRSATSAEPERPMPLLCYAALLGFTFVGGLLASVLSGRFRWRLDMGPGFRDVVTGDPVVMVLLLFVGGVLVGFGTRMAGGCSSGHGLTGCSRLQPISILATAVFFGSAVAGSWLLWKVV